MGDGFPQALLGIQQQIKKLSRDPNILLYSDFQNHKKIKVKGISHLGKNM